MEVEWEKPQDEIQQIPEIKPQGQTPLPLSPELIQLLLKKQNEQENNVNPATVMGIMDANKLRTNELRSEAKVVKQILREHEILNMMDPKVRQQLEAIQTQMATVNSRVDQLEASNMALGELVTDLSKVEEPEEQKTVISIPKPRKKHWYDKILDRIPFVRDRRGIHMLSSGANHIYKIECHRCAKLLAVKKKAMKLDSTVKPNQYLFNCPSSSHGGCKALNALNKDLLKKHDPSKDADKIYVAKKPKESKKTKKWKFH
ncbi:MAG: hypothetical protein CMO81_00545 [Waddliaceae bacterium]|nr:hypothetical protein [Waddliaceae bacterium]